MYYNITLTNIKIGFKNLIAKYFNRLKAVVVVRALYIYLYPLIYLKDLKL